jgi:hypothetical protein
MYIDDSYAIDDGTMDSTGTKTTGPTEWYWQFTPLTNDTLRNIAMYYPGASGQAANWSLTITGGGVNATRGMSYSPSAKGWFKSTSTFAKLNLQKDTAYTFYFKLNSGPPEAGDGANGLAYYTLVDSNNSANNRYGVVHPEILSNFYYPGGSLPYTIPYKTDVDQGGFLLPMVRPVFSGALNFLPVELVSLTAERLPNNSVSIAWKTANEINASRFEVFRGSDLVGSAMATNSPSGAEYALIDRSNTEFGAQYQLFESDRDGSYRQIGSVEIGPSLQGSSLLAWYPNPASNILKIEAGNEISSLQLIDELGRPVRSATPQSSKFELNVSDVPNGAYSLIVSINGKQRVLKITISH